MYVLSGFMIIKDFEFVKFVRPEERTAQYVDAVQKVSKAAAEKLKSINKNKKTTIVQQAKVMPISEIFNSPKDLRRKSNKSVSVTPPSPDNTKCGNQATRERPRREQIECEKCDYTCSTTFKLSEHYTFGCSI